MYAEDPQIFASTIIITLEIPPNLRFLFQRRNFPNLRNSKLKHTNISNIFIYKAVDNYIYLGCSIYSLYITIPLAQNLPNALRLVCASRYAYQYQLRVFQLSPFYVNRKNGDSAGENAETLIFKKRKTRYSVREHQAFFYFQKEKKGDKLLYFAYICFFYCVFRDFIC